MCSTCLRCVFFSIDFFESFSSKKQLLCLCHGSLLMSCVKRDRICARSNVNRPMRRPGLLSAPKKNLHISRGLMQHVSNNTSADRMHPLNQSLIFAPFLLNLLLNTASVNVFRNVVQLKFAAILRNIRTVLQYFFLVIIYSIYFILLGPSIFIFNAIFMIRVQSSLHPVQTIIFGSDTIIFCTFSIFPLYTILHPVFVLIEDFALWISNDK